MQHFNDSEYLRSPGPDLESRRTGNGRYLSSTTCTQGELAGACKALRTSMNKLFVAASLIALSKHSGSAGVSVEWTFNGRDENWKKDLIGITISSVPVAVDMSEINTPGETPGELDRLIVVYESGFDINALLPQGTEVTLGYDMLTGVFTRFQIIIFESKDADAPISFYINYDSNL